MTGNPKKNRFRLSAHASYTRVAIGGGHADFLFDSSAIPLIAHLEHERHPDESEVTIASAGGEPVRVVDEGKGAFSLVFSKQAWFYGLGAVDEAADRRGGPFRMVTVDTQLYRLKGANYSTFPVLWARVPIAPHQHTCFCFVLASSFPYEVHCFESRVLFRPLTDMEGEGADLVVIADEPPEINQALARLTGMPAMPPAWALGYHQSRWSYKTEHEVLAVANALRAHELPADCIHLDIHYMHDYRVFTWHPKRFPHPRRLHDKLAALKLRTVAIVDPGVAQRPDDETYRGLHAGKYFLTAKSGETYVGKVWPGRSLFPDFLRKEVRAFWAARHRVLLEAGVSGIWNDMNEPTLHNSRYIEPTTTGVRHHTGTHNRMRNLYANRMAEAAYDGQHAVHPGKRPFVLSRSGFLGIQRHAAIWTGDNFSHWKQLRANLHMVLNLGLSGIPLAGADVGGFGSRRGPLGLFKLRRPKRELFVRWMELGSFMPFFRSHNTQYSPSQEPWAFGPKTLRLCRDQLQRRYRLLPTLYALAWEAAELGTPIVRPAWYHNDYGAVTPEDAFFFGPDVLVFPVVHPGVTEHTVTLPDGLFINADTFAEVRGKHQAPAPLGTIPHFVRADALLLTCEGALCAADALKGPVTIDVYAAQTGVERSVHLVLDDGDTELTAPVYSAVRATLWHRSDTAGSTLRIDWKRDDWAERPHLRVRIRGIFASASADGAPLPLASQERGPLRDPWTQVDLPHRATHLRFER